MVVVIVEIRKLLQLFGFFGFQQFIGEWNNGEFVFEEVKVKLQNGYYILSGKLKIGDSF